MDYEQLHRLAAKAKTLTAAALNNLDIQHYIQNYSHERVWTEEVVRRSPPVRVEYEYAIIFGTVGESLGYAKHKNFGAFRGVEPLQPEDPVDYYRITCAFTDANPYQKKFMQRKRMRELLPKKFRKYVTKAKRSTKTEFLKLMAENVDAAAAIAAKFKLDAGEFWRASKGKTFITLPPKARQLTMFDLA